MSNYETNPFSFYAAQSATTDPGRYAALFDGLPRDVASLVKVVQGVLLHIFWAERYGVKLSEERRGEVNLRRTEAQLARLIDHIKEAKATAIFLETGSNPNLAEQITQETGIKVVSELFTHSITEAGGKAPTYIDMMKYNVKAIVDALK